MPIEISEGGMHASDLIIASGIVDESIRTVQKAVLAKMKEWLPPPKSSNSSTQPNASVQSSSPESSSLRAALAALLRW